VYIRSLFDANRTVYDPRTQKVRIIIGDSPNGRKEPLLTRMQILFTETEKLLEKWKHPDPYRPPSAPGGSKFERNMPPPDLPPPSREDVRRL